MKHMSICAKLSSVCSFIACTLFLLCGNANLAECAEATGPLHSLTVAQQGVDACDSDIFNRAVDVNSVVSNASTALLAALRKQAADGTLPDSNFSMALTLAGAAESSGQMELLKQFLISEVKGFLATGINDGYFAGKPQGKLSASRGSLASTLEKMPKGRRELIPGKVISNEDGKAVISATFVDPGAGRIPLKLGVEKQNAQWRVVEIVNAKEVFDKAASRAR